MRLRGAGGLAGILVLAAVIVAPLLHPPDVVPAATTPTPAFSGDPAAIERGSALFAAQCVTCHGTGGKGDGPAAASLEPKPIDFTNPMHRMHTDQDLTAWISNGVPGSAMPAFGETLSPAEIADVITFIRSLQAQAATNQTFDIPSPQECTIAPKPPESFKPAGTITPQPTPTSQPNVGPDTFPWPQGDPASQEEIDGVTRTIREFHACANAGDYPRRLALYTDRAIRPQFDALDNTGWQSALEFAATPATIVPEGERGWIDTITAVRHLPDGRVGAYVVAIDPVNHPHQSAAVVILAKVGDRWLIDEVHQDPSGSLAAKGTPTSGTGPPNAGVGTPVTSAGVIARLTEATIANGEATLRFEITDANGAPLTDAKVDLTAEMAEMPMGSEVVSATPDGDGRYRAVVPVTMSGNWQAQIAIARDGKPSASFVFHFSAS